MPARAYRDVIRYTAGNDDPAERDPETIAKAISTDLIAWIFYKDRAKVAQDIATHRDDFERHLPADDDQAETFPGPPPTTPGPRRQIPATRMKR